MKGLELAEQLYRDAVRERIDAEFAEYAPRIAVGLAGPGSECFGYDDEISQDHDFAPRLCLWLTEADARAIGARLLERYEAWTAEYAPVTATAQDRSGPIAIPDFYRRFTGCPGAPKDNVSWLRVPEHLLAAATNGRVFRDDLGEFSAVRSALLAGYPADVRRKRLAARLFRMGQAGQYNLPRCLKRGDAVAARFAETEFLRAALETVCLLNGRYAPYYKWLYRCASELPLCAGAVRDAELAKATREYGLDAAGHPNWFDASCIPWLSYDALNIELPDGHLFFSPIVNWGKYREENGRLMMPVSVRLNHAVADGYLVANVFRLLQKEIGAFSGR